MSNLESDMDRVRRIANLRSPRKKSTPIYNVADFDAQGNHISPDISGEISGDPDADLIDLMHANGSTPAASSTPTSAIASSPRTLDALVPGYEIVNGAGVCYCAVRAFALDEARGTHLLGSLLDVPPALFHRYHPTFGLGEVVDYRRAAFIDTETTGLGGGAGVYCFMVGVGTFEAYQPYAADQLPVAPDPTAPATHFVVRQFFMRNPAEEGALLVALADLLVDYEMTVTFNGRAFDLPLLRLRYMQNRRYLPLTNDAPLLQANRPHLDLLMPARRIWRRRLQSCRLINLEQMILGLQRTEEDVPGALIPEIYHRFVQSGHADALRGVFYHNHEDIVTMVSLADHLSRAFGDAPANHKAIVAPVPTVTGMDWLGLARAHARAGDFDQAIAAYTRGLESVTHTTERAEIFAALGELYKRQRQWREAAETWHNWITSVAGSDPTPYIELAKYCEWVTRDLEQAEMWTGWALHTAQKASRTPHSASIQRDLQHRLARIQRKRGGQSDMAATS